MRTIYPDAFVDPHVMVIDAGHFYLEEVRTISSEQPYSAAVKLSSSSLQENWEKVNISFMALQEDTLNKALLMVQWYDSLGNDAANYYPCKDQIKAIGKWDFATFTLPVDEKLRSAQMFKIYVFNPSASPIQVKGLDVSFRPAFLKPGVKGQSDR